MVVICGWLLVSCFFFFQAEDGIRDLVRSRGLGDVYKRQGLQDRCGYHATVSSCTMYEIMLCRIDVPDPIINICLLYTSDAADERSSVDLGGRRIIKKKITR